MALSGQSFFPVSHVTQYANIFIPDVSGSTELLIKTAPDHSSHIINELLSVLFESNNSDLTLLELEEETLLFFRKGEAGAGSSVGDLKKYCGGRIFARVAN